MADVTHHRAQVAELSQRLVDELDRHGADEPVDSPTWLTVGAITGHVASIYGWVAEIVRTGEPARRSEAIFGDTDAAPAVAKARARMLMALDEVDSNNPCWIIGGTLASPAFWARRMVFETIKRLIDLRSAGTENSPVVPAELTVELAADGLDEFFAVFLARSRPTLPELTGSIAFVATDVERAWSLTSEWLLDTLTEADVVVRATAPDLLLLLWERADALTHANLFTVEGDRAIVAALQSAPIHV
jgi:hypothetical protein